MTTYIEYQMEDGTTVLVRGAEEERGMHLASNDGEARTVQSKEKFEKALDDVDAMTKTMKKKFMFLDADEIELKFGLETAGEVGNFAIGKISLGVNYEVTLKWKKDEKKQEKS